MQMILNFPDLVRKVKCSSNPIYLWLGAVVKDPKSIFQAFLHLFPVVKLRGSLIPQERFH